MNEQEIERRLVALEKTVEKLRSSLFPLANGDMPPPNISRITSIQWLCANEYGITISDMPRFNRKRDGILTFSKRKVYVGDGSFSKR